MKYKQPEEFFSYLKEEFGTSVFNDTQKCLAIASDMFEGDKQVTFLIKTAFNNKVYTELLKARNSTSENKVICIERAIKILTDDCCLENEKALNAVGWLANNLYNEEWSSYTKQKVKLIYNTNNEDNDIEWEIPPKKEKIKTNKEVESSIQKAKDFIKTKNYEEALNILKPLVDKRNAQALFEIGVMYRDGLHLSQNINEALKYFNLAANQGNIDAQKAISNLTSYKEENTKKGLDYLLEKAKVLFNSKQYKEAYALFEQVAVQGNFEGQIWLDYMKKNGLGVEKTYNPTAYKQDFSDSTETSFNVNFDYNYSNFPAQNVENFNDIFDAVKNAKYIETIERMLKNGVDPNCISTPDAYTPLSWAARNNSNPEILNILLQYGADPNIKDNFGMTALMNVARYHDNTQSLRLLLENGAKPNRKDNNDWTALMMVARYFDNYDSLKVLLEYGADPNIHEANNWNSLMFVANNSQNINCLQILLEYGAKPNKTNCDGNTALDIADSRNMKEMVDILLQYGAEITWKYIQKHNPNSGSEYSSNNSTYESNNSGGCFITTAVCDSFNKPDDCYELTMFRQFRDNWLTKEEDGKALIKEYYNNAPKIVENIDSHPNKAEIYLDIWNNYLKDCLHFIENKKYAECKTLYIKMVRELEKKYCWNC